MIKLISASFATFGAFLEACGTIIEKKVLRKPKMDSKSYTVYEFIAIVLVSIPIFLILSSFFPHIFSWQIGNQAFQLKNLLILLGIIISGILANLFVFYAMKGEKIVEITPIRLTQPFFIILLALIFYSSERQTPMNILIAALIASLALVLSHIRKHHFVFNKYAIAALAGSFFFAVDLALSKPLLTIYSPLSLYFIRSIIILIICLFIFKPDFKNTKGVKSLILLSGLIWIVYRSVLYYSYTLKGLIFSTLLFLLSPIFTYLLSYIYLKEKLTWRNLIATIIIVICILYALMISNGS